MSAIASVRPPSATRSDSASLVNAATSDGQLAPSVGGGSSGVRHPRPAVPNRASAEQSDVSEMATPVWARLLEVLGARGTATIP